MRPFLWLVLFWLIAARAEANPLTVRVVVLEHPSWEQGYISDNGLLDTIFGAERLHAEHGDPLLRVVDVKRRKDPFPYLDGVSSRVAKLYSLQGSRLHKRSRRGVGAVYYVASPLTLPGTTTHYMAGIAGAHCTRRVGNALAVGNARDFNDAGINRIEVSQIIMAHEIGHLMGMRHKDSKTIMHADALSLLVKNELLVSWDPVNIDEMRSCSSRGRW